jgi:2-oxoglutarate ferredoxin oxidoreductase subunit alpha
MKTDISVMIAGKAGDGVLFTGNVLAKILKRQGWEIVTYRNFPSNIRGEATNYTIRASQKNIHGSADKIDVLMAFDCDAILKHIGSVAEEGIILCEGKELTRLNPEERTGRTFHAFPMRKLAREKLGKEIFKNMILLGGLCYILDLDFSIITQIISDFFIEKKGRDVVQKNVQAIHLGCEEAKKIVPEKERHRLKSKRDLNRLLLSGDEAIALGALVAGCRFFAAYPICPATEIWMWLALVFPRYEGLVVQTEDEMAAINMALGASYTGVRAMTSTSGPGASLMMEGFSLAGMAEIPIVVVHVQRVGPSTGLPTKSEQADLTQWIHGAHGDFPRIVLSPGTIKECYQFTIKAFNLADRYQCPVILLTEQDYGQNYRTVKNFGFSKIHIDRGRMLSQKELLRINDYQRYGFVQDGISPRVLPSMENGIHMVESNEHDVRGYRDESSHNRKRMMEKRMQKLISARKDLIRSKIWGKRTSDIGIIGCGSILGPTQEAMEQLLDSGIETKYMQIRTLWPFLSTEVENFINSCERIFVVDNNFEGQLKHLIKSQVNHKDEIESIVNYSGQTFRPLEISGFIQKALKR